MFDWFSKRKEILTEKQKAYITRENNEWFTDKEIFDSFYFEIPKGNIKISEKVIYFNLAILTGLQFEKLPGDPQSLSWYFHEKWESKSNNVKLFLETEFGLNLPFKFKGIEIPYEGLLFALNNSSLEELIYVSDNSSNEKTVYITTNLNSGDYIESFIDFEKYNLDKEKFYASINYYLEINEIQAFSFRII